MSNDDKIERTRMWPSYEAASSIFDLENWFLIGALALGVISTGLVIWMGNVKEGYLRKDVSSAGERASIADAQAATAGRDAAKANEAAAALQAQNIALEAQIAPRRLKSEDVERLVLVLRRHPGEIIAIVSYALDAEAAALGEQLIRILRSENFPFDDRRMSLSALGNISMGLRITGANAAFASELRDLFNSCGLPASDEAPSLGTGMTMGNPLAAAPVNLFIGVKPIQ